MLPNLIIIGAQKCGTTALHYYLGLHPQIRMSADKELNFFVGDRNWRRGRRWYERQFRGWADVHGEASPSYTNYPRFKRVAERMHDMIPDAKLIYLVRDPIDRIVSHYIHSFSDRREHQPFAEALGDMDQSLYVQRSRYFLQTSRFLEYYPMSRILIVDQADLWEHRRETLAKTFAWLGVDSTFYCDKYGREKHESADKRRKNPIAYWMKRISETRPAKMVSSDARKKIGRVLYRPFSRDITTPVVDESMKSRLVNALSGDISQFRKLAGMPFDRWSV